MTVARFMRDVVDPRAVAPSPPRRQEGDLHSEFLELPIWKTRPLEPD